MYAGFHEAYSSARLEAYRIGFENLVLLQKLQKQDSGWVESLVCQVFRRYDDYEKELKQYRRIRRPLPEKAAAEASETNIV